MQVKNPILHNEYHLVLRNVLTGETKCAIAYNTMCYGYFNGTGGTFLQCGSGTGEPAYTDTGLFESLGFGSAITWQNGYYNKANNTMKYVGTAVIPASSTCVGEITELAIKSTWSATMTHALLKDAEGNNISINKTDLDELTITVIVYIQASSNDNYKYLIATQSGKFNKNALKWFFTGGASNYYTIIYANYSSTKHTWYVPIYNKSYELSRVKMASDNKLTNLKLSNRLTTADSNERWIHSIEITDEQGRFLQVPFPNPLVPAYEVHGISLGTGDGSTTEFSAPIGLFVKDSDKVYINGVLQTRGIDYTIDNKANRSRLIDITPGNFLANFKNSQPIASWPGSWKPTQLSLPFALLKDTYFEQKPVVMKDNPLLIELSEDQSIGTEINYWVPGYWYLCNSTGGTTTGTADGVTLTLSYSTDGEVYTEVDSFTFTSSLADAIIPRSFDKVNAKYWKLESANIKEGYMLHKSAVSNTNNAFELGILGYFGEPIKFTNPPAEGDLITMDCSFDRPYKNSNFVLDVSIEWNFR